MPIKVDREERPDVDAVYMTATQAMTGQGGWPMTVFATPDGEPFFCGTYFPRDGNFVRLVRRGRRGVAGPAGGGAAAGRGGGRGDRRRRRPPAAPAPLDAGRARRRRAELWREYDEAHGGFGGAPKFPPHMELLFLLRHHQRTGDERVLEMVRHTCEAMARGGMYDQLAGGFARYSVDDALDGAALREDAVRQRAAAAGVHAAVAAHRRRAGRAGWPPRWPTS